MHNCISVLLERQTHVFLETTLMQAKNDDVALAVLNSSTFYVFMRIRNILLKLKRLDLVVYPLLLTSQYLSQCCCFPGLQRQLLLTFRVMC